ncbi:hypothetical protein BDA96_10G031200 [Sorghum bicolor]|uniref:Uncharacterized protein n=2 Tax=Sorghum bicolor TaxID=4558 RepID=A0A921TY80_SORBI|nr:uncharacterized protein LOC110430847 isoform X2 [Sorghum bicolor]XP_021304614.1 uncharacterized protein LOC110430847 isoform X2 [Sorghum bicolor]KAG0512634.1 hypothetical protein BDA96_10G031200 [Sorghum bicolor]KAG0512637.1 hypothetical protein BDA96_10G031200 [Sorghum bicolor]KXG19235.1 hypothetical protein SORBI_3010G027100 [Sorghum bicolor]KXG19236.1 hypothetical protein SORBI_3010G027100 [Sorghum bicolor]|eukprot:XP_021304613.1 uncharacterized protein LOC110430847 isoform X2 [Sorghum bicolor]
MAPGPQSPPGLGAAAPCRQIEPPLVDPSVVEKEKGRSATRPPPAEPVKPQGGPACRFVHRGHCFGCKNKNHGSPDMLHPVEADADTGGHLDGYLPFDFDALSSSDDDDGEYEYLNKDEDEEEEFEAWLGCIFCDICYLH